MIFWITLILLLLNASLNSANVHCKKYNARMREYQSALEREYCESDVYAPSRDYYCRIPIIYSYCVCNGHPTWNQEENNLTSYFLEDYFKNNKELLKKVYINDSFIGEIEVNAFSHLENLSELYLQNNNISTIGKGVFNILTNLTLLDISNNQVDIIENKSFYGLINLEKLNVSYNKIQSISRDIFDRNLNSMRILDLSHNLISAIEFTVISNIFKHQSFNILNDIISEHDNNFLELNLSFNKLKKFNFFLVHLNRVNLNNNNLDTLNNLVYSKLIRELDLSNNRISKFNYAPESIIYLNLRGNILQNLNISISNGSKIQTLDVSQNLIKKLELNVFTNMSNLNNLYLQNNNLTELPIGIFKNLKNLEILSLSGNHLQKFEFGTFSGLSNLLGLDISNNSFGSMNFKAFYILSNLTTLNIANNNLVTLDPNDVLDNCENMKLIKLNNNPWNCDSLFHFTKTLKKFGIQVIEGSNSNIKNHLGHACHDMVTKYPDKNVTFDNHIIKAEVSDIRNLLESEFHNFSVYNLSGYHRNHSISFQANLSALNDYFNKDFKNTLFYKSFNKNISINFPKKYDETFNNLTDTLRLINLQLSNLNQTNVLNSELLNLTTNYERKFNNLDLFNKTIVNPLNSNLAKLSKSVEEISKRLADDNFKESYFYQLFQTKFQNDSLGQILHQVPQINPETLTGSNISSSKLIGFSAGNHDVVQEIESLRGTFIALMIILITILLCVLLLPVIKRFINPLTRKSHSIDSIESTANFALVESVHQESLDEQAQ